MPHVMHRSGGRGMQAGRQADHGPGGATKKGREAEGARTAAAAASRMHLGHGSGGGGGAGGSDFPMQAGARRCWRRRGPHGAFGARERKRVQRRVLRPTLQRVVSIFSLSLSKKETRNRTRHGADTVFGGPYSNPLRESHPPHTHTHALGQLACLPATDSPRAGGRWHGTPCYNSLHCTTL